MCVCIYIYIYVYIHTRTYTYLYLRRTSPSRTRPGPRSRRSAGGTSRTSTPSCAPARRWTSSSGATSSTGRTQSCTSQGIRRLGRALLARNFYVSTLRPVVLCPYLCTAGGQYRPAPAHHHHARGPRGPVSQWTVIIVITMVVLIGVIQLISISHPPEIAPHLETHNLRRSRPRAGRTTPPDSTLPCRDFELV